DHDAHGADRGLPGGRGAAGPAGVRRRAVRLLPRRRLTGPAALSGCRSVCRPGWMEDEGGTPGGARTEGERRAGRGGAWRDGRSADATARVSTGVDLRRPGHRGEVAA